MNGWIDECKSVAVTLGITYEGNDINFGEAMPLVSIWGPGTKGTAKSLDNTGAKPCKQPATSRCGWPKQALTHFEALNSRVYCNKRPALSGI